VGSLTNHFDSNVSLIDAGNTTCLFRLSEIVAKNGANSGTAFYQIADEANINNRPFHYLCLGVQKQSNTKSCFARANELGIQYIPIEEFHLSNIPSIRQKLTSFIDRVDAVYLTIDLEGFSSAFAPGVSAPSPLGFSPDLATEVIRIMLKSGKLISMDIAELNPNFDIDNRTARLATILIHRVTSLN
jgi:formiminoglutamase